MTTETVFLLFIAAFLLISELVGMRDRRAEERKKTRELQEAFGKKGNKSMPEGRYPQVPGYFLRHKKTFSLDDITWQDLDMDLLYRDMDTTCSAAGEEYLYYLLRTPALRSAEYAFKEEQLSYWNRGKDKETLRLKVQRILQRCGQTGKYSIYEYLSLFLQQPDRPLYRDLPALVLPAVSFGVLYLSRPAGTLLLIASLVFNLLTYMRDKRRIEPYFETIRAVLRLFRCADLLCREMKQAESLFSRELKAMAEASARFSSFKRGSTFIVQEKNTGNPLDILADYACTFFHLDLLVYGSILRKLKEQELSLDELITAIGRIDVSIAIASYRVSLPVFCVPALAENERPFFEGRELFHPLLAEPVRNDFSTERPILVTGSNASGKSTFLKGAALCSIMAQTVQTVPAAEFSASFFRVYSSMALRDSILDGESYFIVEIRSLRRIIDAAREKDPALQAPVLCCIDEVLRGTNTVERISASTEILKALAKENLLIFAATHDLELTDLLRDYYDNYHFSEELLENDVRFSYKILPGEATTRNAIRLLRIMGYDSDLTENAEKRAASFLETGIWQK